MWRPKQGALLQPRASYGSVCKCVTGKYAPTTAAATEQPVFAKADVRPLSSHEINVSD